MERRTTLALALAAGGTVAAASAAFAVNVGLLRQDSGTPGGILDANVLDASFATDTTLPSDPTAVTVFVDDPAPVGATESSGQIGSTTSTSIDSSDDDDHDEVDDSSGSGRDDDHDEVEDDHDDDSSGSGHDDDD